MVIEGLSLLIKDVKSIGKLFGVTISPYVVVRHIFFVDDVVLFGLGLVNKWLVFFDILNLFCGALGMVISAEKSIFL